jgi:hypothetical protein
MNYHIEKIKKVECSLYSENGGDMVLQTVGTRPQATWLRNPEDRSSHSRNSEEDILNSRRGSNKRMEKIR